MLKRLQQQHAVKAARREGGLGRGLQDSSREAWARQLALELGACAGCTSLGVWFFSLD
jgi:electron transfer flavoprotein alpha subunit